MLEKARDYAAREAACSMSTRGSFAKFDPVSSLWKIPHFLFAGELSKFSGKWPRWGMMVRGECYPLPTWEAVINVTAFGERSGDAIEYDSPGEESATGPTPCAHDKLAGTSKPHGFIVDGVERQRNLNDMVARTESAPWPTPTAKGNGNREEYGGRSRDGIDTAVKRAEGIIPTATQSAPWPTPRAGGSRSGLDGGSNSRKAARKRGHYIPNSVSAWPTPTANDYKGSGRNGELRDRLDYAVERGATKSHTYPTPTLGDNHYRKGGDTQASKCLGAMAVRGELSAYPTPCARDHHAGGPGNLDPKNGHMVSLSTLIEKSHQFPTIGTKTMGGCSGSQHKLEELERIGALRTDERRVLQSGNGGVANCGWLNPDWIEWLMNWPQGWTDPDATELVWLLPEYDPADLAPDADGYVPRITGRKEYRIKRVETLGNGQFPLTAVAAFIFGRAILAAALTKENHDTADNV